MKVKICFKCQTQNSEHAWSCINCGETLDIKSLREINIDQSTSTNHSTQKSQGDFSGFEYVESIPGSSEPADIFELHMPGVDVLSDMDAFFMKARELLEVSDVSQLTKEEREKYRVTIYEGVKPGQKHIALVTPGRMILLIPLSSPNLQKPSSYMYRNLLPDKVNLCITAISYTKFDAFMQDKEKTKCIPFLGHLFAFAYLGHNVIVFEGHSSALEAGVKDCNVLLIDSGMLPFLQEDWADIVFKSVEPDARIYLHDRENYQLLPIVRKKSHPGWRISEPDGEASYVNMFLTVLAKENDKTRIVSIVSGKGLPDLSNLTTDPEELDYISTLPFKYNQLDADIVINTILSSSKGTLFNKSTRKLKGKVALSKDEAIDVSYQLLITNIDGGKRQLDIKLL